MYYKTLTIGEINEKNNFINDGNNITLPCMQ